MAGLPHWKNSQAATNYYEPIFLNQFEVVITPPQVITKNVNLLVEHVTKITGLPEITPTATVEQKYKFAQRSFAAAAPEKTTADLAVTFTVNLNDDNEAYIYNIIRAWSDITYDPLTGRQGLKKDYVGQMAVTMFNKQGKVFREFKFTPVFPFGKLTEMQLDYSSMSLYELTVNFRADNWTETRTGEIKI